MGNTVGVRVPLRARLTQPKGCVFVFGPLALATLADLGLALEPGVTIDDLLYSFDREAYEKRPFDLVLFTLGVEVEREPWGRPFCRRVWNFDTECITGDGAYVSIAKRLCEVAGRPDAFSDLQDHVDINASEAWIAYTVDGSSAAGRSRSTTTGPT